MPLPLRIVYYLYIIGVALPLLVVATIVAAVLTVVFSPWANTRLGYAPARLWSWLVCLMFWVRVRVSGTENIRPGQSYVFAANHQSMFDIWTIYGWLPVFFKWVMKDTLRHIPFVGWACEKAGHIFINRESPRASKRSLDRAEQVLRGGVSVVIFPEGTRTDTGRVGRFKRGGFFLATDLGLPVIPITLQGCRERLPKHSLLLTPGTIHMTIHPPVDVASYQPDGQRQLADRVHDIVASAL